MFINLKPQGQRPPMSQVVEQLRRKVRAVPGIQVFMRPIQNLQLGGRQSKAQYQYILQSVKADELNDWALRIQSRLRDDPLFRDVTSDSQLRGLQASLRVGRLMDEGRAAPEMMSLIKRNAAGKVAHDGGDAAVHRATGANAQVATVGCRERMTPMVQPTPDTRRAGRRRA